MLKSIHVGQNDLCLEKLVVHFQLKQVLQDLTSVNESILKLLEVKVELILPNEVCANLQELLFEHDHILESCFVHDGDAEVIDDLD